MTDPDGEIARLQRRVNRERAARREAEAIAERSTRMLYDRQQELVLLESIAAAANRADGVQDALQFALDQVCAHLKWAIGQAWLVDEQTGNLRYAPVGYVSDDARFAPFLAGSASRAFAPGEGLPGRVLASGEATWIPDVTRDENFPRAPVAREVGLRVGVGFPVHVDERVVAVLECFGEAALQLTPEILRVVAHVGEQLAPVFERARTERQLRYDAHHDVLTDLPNRALFHDRLEQALALSRRADFGVAVALIDLNRFKEVNDTLGHQHGDQLLIEVGARLRQTLGESDTIARLGGDEFGLVLARVDDETDALAVAERVTLALRDPLHLDGVLIQVDASVGLALHPQHGHDASILLRHADVAMYQAKRSHVAHLVYTPIDDPYSPDRLGLVAELRRALDTRQLVLHYQPKVSVRTGALAGVEALVRWQHPVRGPVPPSEFIPIAEHTGLIRPLTTYVLTMALEQSRRWLDDGMAVPIAVNISARTLLDEGFPGELAELLARARVPAELIELEVTESSMLRDPEKSLRLLDQLSEMGVRIAIDDFGTGYSSMAQLKQLPVGQLKIDRGFIAAMGQDDRDVFIVRSAIQLGHDLGMSIVAEGVEDTETLSHLQDLGCDTAQGYLIHRPVAPEQLTRWLRERSAPGASASAAA